MTKAMISGRSPIMPLPPMPSAPITTCRPTSCNAMYGMVATMPVTVIASATQFTSRTASPSDPADLRLRCSTPFRHEIDDRRERGADQHPQQLVPIEERDARTVDDDLHRASARRRERDLRVPDRTRDGVERAARRAQCPIRDRPEQLAVEPDFEPSAVIRALFEHRKAHVERTG